MHSFLSLIDPIYTKLLYELPSECPLCHTWTRGWLCKPCASSFCVPKQRCRTCAMPLLHADISLQCMSCIQSPPPLQNCIALCDYVYPYNELIRAFKFKQRPALVHLFYAWFKDNSSVWELLDQADWIVPIALAPKRLGERGYNQSLLIAKMLVKRGNSHKLGHDLLLRVKETSPQPGLGQQERFQNLKAAFCTQPTKQNTYKNKHFVLIDDVMTSGASLHSAANTLKQAGANAVSAIVLARAVLNQR